MIRALLQKIATIAVLLAPALTAHAATPPAVLQAKKWDIAVAIGAGGYRGDKDISGDSKLKHVIEPGAFIDGMKVDGHSDSQWKIDGAYLKECRISGDLGTRLSAKDSALEACNFFKSGAWFVQWAGTRWRFENCMITRSFMRSSFGLHDYAVYAKETTFAGISMPKLGLRNDPSKYAGGDDNAFIRCRFIGCEIPESVLAMSVDCVFENCKFDLKFDPNQKKDIWLSPENPVNVRAFIAGGGSVPAPHTHGKLNVKFVPASANVAAGCKLPFTQAGSKIMVPWSRQITKFNPLGNVDKPASLLAAVNAEPEKPKPAAPPAAPAPAPAPQPPQPMPEVPPSSPSAITGPNSFLNLPTPDAKPAPAPMPVAPPPATPPALPVTPPTPAAPAAKDVRSLDDLTSAVPLSTKLVSAGKVNPAALEEASKALSQRSEGRTALLRVSMQEITPNKEDGYAFLLKGEEIPIRINGERVAGFIRAKFRVNQAQILAKLSKGGTLNIRGTITRAELSGSDKGIKFIVTLDEAAAQ